MSYSLSTDHGHGSSIRDKERTSLVPITYVTLGNETGQALVCAWAIKHNIKCLQALLPATSKLVILTKYYTSYCGLLQLVNYNSKVCYAAAEHSL